jgi:hypothetical protein
MPKRIQITVDDIQLTAELNDSPSAQQFLAKLPLDVSMSRWGDEYYGDAGLQVTEEPEARSEMKVGELAVWPQGGAVCIFFGPTPASHDQEPRAVSGVNPIGAVLDDPLVLKKLGGSVSMRFVLA